MRRRATGRSLAQQAFALRGRFPDAKLDLSVSRLVWTGWLTPTSLSRTYTVEVTCRIGRIPEVRVIEPQLDGRLGEVLPHVYGGGTLCLHRAGEWTGAMLVVDSIVPWSVEWLIYYEIWKATGDWHGGGQSPPVEPSNSPAERAAEQFAAPQPPSGDQG